MEEGEFDRALFFARQLHKRSYTGAFEVEARALAGQGDTAAAIRILEDAAAQFPPVYILWSYLGEFLSNTGRYDEASWAFESFARNGGDNGVARFNLAVVAYRKGDYEACLDLLIGAAEPHEGAPERTRGLAYIEMGRPEEAMKIGDPGVTVRALAALGREQEAREAARELLIADHGDNDARAALLELGPAGAPAARWSVLVDGDRPGGRMTVPPEDRFFVRYWVDADDENEAFSFIRAFEPMARDLRTERIERTTEAPGERKGVIFVNSGYTLYSTITYPWWKRWITPKWLRGGGARIHRLPGP